MPTPISSLTGKRIGPASNPQSQTSAPVAGTFVGDTYTNGVQDVPNRAKSDAALQAVIERNERAGEGDPNARNYLRSLYNPGDIPAWLQSGNSGALAPLQQPPSSAGTTIDGANLIKLMSGQPGAPTPTPYQVPTASPGASQLPGMAPQPGQPTQQPLPQFPYGQGQNSLMNQVGASGPLFGSFGQLQGQAPPGLQGLLSGSYGNLYGLGY